MKCRLCTTEINPYDDDDIVEVRVENTVVIEDTALIVPCGDIDGHAFDGDCVGYPPQDDREITETWSRKAGSAVFCSRDCMLSWFMITDRVFSDGFVNELDPSTDEDEGGRA